MAADAVSIDAHRQSGTGALPTLVIRLACHGPELAVRVVMPDDAAIGRRGAQERALGMALWAVRPVIGRPKPCCGHDLCHACY
jgi:hypothetical protein